ncbi:MAG: alpha/beta hydrolase-fold protein [Chitinophagaceae bacterium]
MERAYVKWFSPVLHKELELLVFGFSGTPVLFFPTRTAHFYDYENWRIIQAMDRKIQEGQLQVFCVDSIDIESFYAPVHPAERIRRHLQYEEYILSEVLPFIRKKNNNPLIAAGCSLGGYHAVNIAFKHPELFSKVVGMSARYDLTLSTNSFADLFDGYFDDNIYYNMPGMFIPNLSDERILKRLRKMKIIIVIGKGDPFFESNLQLSNALGTKNVPHDFRVWDEDAHRPRYWRQMVQLYL